MTNYVTEQSAGDIVKNTFEIYRTNLRTLCLIYLVPVIPFSIVSIMASSSDSIGLILFTTILEVVIGYFALGAMTVAISDVCIGHHPSFTRSYGMLWRVIGRYFSVFALSSIIVVVGFALLIVPGIIASVLLMFALTCVILERRSWISALKRSIALGKGYYWRNVGVFLLVLLIVFVIQIVTMILCAFLFFNGDFEAGIGLDIIGALLGYFLGPLTLIPIVLLYYDMRVHKEHFDRSTLSQELMV